ncbi:gluconokinase [Budvicia aquatica]|uniref:Gluconokinase n=2 Tax=Budvicia aquatica TaxID=82979 RepID=A0A2C6DGM0_9GAMM|nr:gluconokinase [Budvicia aquatica]PHI28357.1 gluconate kinase [Budvicia aquatica]
MAGQSIIIMGVSGSGKSRIGAELAKRLNAKFIDGDDLHPKVNIQKMAIGHPLDDKDREPWLERLNDAAYSLRHKDELGFIVCSALKRHYRDCLRQGNPEMVFLYMKGSFDVILDRLKARAGHYMPVELLRSQFDILEEPGIDENDIICVDIDGSFHDVVQRGLNALNKVGIETRKA